MRAANTDPCCRQSCYFLKEELGCYNKAEATSAPGPNFKL